MTAFQPLTVGYDWELWLLGPTGEPVKEDVLLDIAAAMRRARPECPTDLDFRSLEIRSGACRHVDELRERSEALLGLAAREAGKRKMLFLTSAGHPVYFNVLGAHVHVGSLYDLDAAVRLRAALSRWVPALIALSVASPVVDGRVGEFKSYRVAQRAHGCDNPIACGDPVLSDLNWGEDACVKVWSQPTLELRLFDAPIHPGLYYEMVALGAGLVAGTYGRLRGEESPARLTRRHWEEYLLNRIGAARNGLQATFRHDGEEVPAVQVVEEAIGRAEDGMTRFGMPPEDLVWIPRLLEGRVTQADFLQELFERNPDPWGFVTDLTALTGDARAFERWLDSGPTRPPAPVASFGNEVMDGVDGFARVRDANRWAQLPPALLAREVRALEKNGRMERVEDPRSGAVLQTGPKRRDAVIRLVSEIESARRIRGARAPWRRVRLQVRVTRSGTPGVKLPATLKDRRLTVERTTTAPESYAPGSVLNLSEVETAPLIAPGVESQNLVSLEGPALRAVVDLELGAVMRDLNLSGEEAGTIARSPLRLGFGEGERADRGGVIWEIREQKALWKAGFRRVRASGDRLVLRQKTGRDEKHVVRTLTVDPSAPLLVDRIEVHPEKKKDGKKSDRPDPVQVKLDVAVRPGCGACARLPERDRLFHRPYSLDPARAWIMWAGTEEFRFRPEGGFAAALGDEGAHVLLFSPKEVDWLVTESRRDHPAMKVIFARRRPPATFTAVHAVGHRIGFGDNRSFALLARSTGVEGAHSAHVVACRRGARAATGSATILDGGRARELTLERRTIDAVGAVYVGDLSLGDEMPGETVVRLGRETIRIEEMS